MLGCQATPAPPPPGCEPAAHSSGFGAQCWGMPTNLLLGEIIVTFSNTITLLFSEDKLGCS